MTMTTTQKYDLDKLNSILDGGLCHGSGDGKKTFCVEQAIAMCAGIPMTDKPDSCVHRVVSHFGRRLNDKNWSSDKARATGMREFAFAQLGTVDIDAKKWVKRVTELTIREVVPCALRAAAKLNPKFKDELEKSAKRCEEEGTELAAAAAAAAAYAADAAAYAADAAAYAAYAADAAAYAAYADAYAADAAAYAADDAAAAAAAAADAAAYAAAYAADDAAAAKDKMLSLSASIATRAIREQIA
jgi:hypothetical protein